MEKDDFDNALRFFERALALEPTNFEILDAAADACIEAVRTMNIRGLAFHSDTIQGHAERAISLLLRSIELAPGVNWHK